METLLTLERTIGERAKNPSANSYTCQLLSGGLEGCCQKFGEEAIELLIAALKQDHQALIHESADLLFHFLVVLQVRGVSLSELNNELATRMAVSGLDEKAGRT